MTTLPKSEHLRQLRVKAQQAGGQDRIDAQHAKAS